MDNVMPLVSFDWGNPHEYHKASLSLEKVKSKRVVKTLMVTIGNGERQIK